MKKWLLAASLLGFFLRSHSQSYDICIYGATSAGVIAAYTAAKMHQSVILVEPGEVPGGLSSGGLGYTDIGNKFAITGIARDFYRRIGKHYGQFETWIFEPHVAEQVFRDYLQEPGITVLYQYRLRSVQKTKQAIQSVLLESSPSPQKLPTRTIRARIFIDCSYEGDLMAKAGVSYTIGREDNSRYGETYNGVQFRDKHQFPDGIDPYKIPGHPESGLLWGISSDSLLPDGTGNRQVQAYNYRLCLSNDPANRIPVTRPAGYDSSWYELLLRLIRAQPGKLSFNDYTAVDHMPHHKTDINNRGGFSTDMIGMNYQYPEASYSERARILQQHELYTKGLLWFLGNDPRVPEALRKDVSQWGYPKDEYPTNNHFTPQAYIRECRRMIGEYVMTQANCQGKATVSDGIGLAAYTMDSHNCNRLVVNGMVKNEGDVEIGGFGPYPISYGALVPKASECSNLLVPVCLSASHIAYGSIRMEPVFMVLGQSSAEAAVLAIREGKSVQQINLSQLQALLKNDPLLDGRPAEILTDNDDSLHCIISGPWQRKGYGGYGPSWLRMAGGEKGAVLFRPDIRVAGRYHLYSYVPSTDSAAVLTHYNIYDGEHSEVRQISTQVRVAGQTSGEWVDLGTYHLPAGQQASVTIQSESAGGTVVADAILWVPEK